MTVKKTIKRPGAVLTLNERRYGGPYYVFAKPSRKQSCWKSFCNGVGQVCEAIGNCTVWVLKAMWKVVVVLAAIGYAISVVLVLNDILCGRRRD